MRAKKSLGQNFLIDRDVIDRIVSALDLSTGKTVIEIGPGRGALTEKLIGTGAHVTAVEIDHQLVAALKVQFHFEKRFRVVEADILQIGLKDLIETNDGSVKVVGNLPYYISTPILQKLAAERHLFSACVLMFQREVVDRITAKPGSSERGLLTVMTEAAFDVERLFDIPPAAFVPQPKVWSSVVRLTPTVGTKIDLDSLFRLASTAFAQKRKTILNNLRSSMDNASSVLVAAEIDPQRRAETLQLGEWQRLVDEMYKKTGHI